MSLLRPERSPLESHAVLAVMLASFLVVPLASTYGAQAGLGLRAFYQLLLLGTLLALTHHRLALGVGIALFALSTFARFAPPLAPTDRAGWANAFGAAFVVLVLYGALRRLFTARRVDAELVSGAVAVYLLLGLFGSLLFGVVEWWKPGSFAGLDAGDPDVALAQLHYFSFVTLTTLGYGDLTPVSPFARSCAVLEAVVGQVYLVVLVARLVALHATADRDD